MSAIVLKNLTAIQLRRAAAIRSRIDKLESKLSDILGGNRTVPTKARRRRFSAVTRAKMAISQRARWARRKSTKK